MANKCQKYKYNILQFQSIQRGLRCQKRAQVKPLKAQASPQTAITQNSESASERPHISKPKCQAEKDSPSDPASFSK